MNSLINIGCVAVEQLSRMGAVIVSIEIPEMEVATV